MDNQVNSQNTNQSDTDISSMADQQGLASGMVQQNQGDTLMSQPQNTQAIQQGLAQPYGAPQQTNMQPVSVSPSPEVPARVERGGERITIPEVSKESSEQKGEQQKEEVVQERSVETPKEVPDQKKFESPFNVYGYKVSSQISDAGKVAAGQKVAGDTNSSKTWLVVLLNRLLKMYKQEDSLNTAEN